MHKKVVMSVALAAMLAMPAQAAPNCVPRQALGDAAIVVLPGVVDRLAQRCAAALPPTAVINQPAARQLRERLAAEGPRRTASAALTFKGSAGGKFPKGVKDATVVALMTEGLPGQLLSDSYLTPGTCADMDQLISAMASMSVDQIGALFSAIFGLVKIDDFTVCPS